MISHGTASEEEDAPVVLVAPPDATPASPWRIDSAGALLAILALINLLNYVDRYVIAGLVPFLRKPVLEGGLGLSLRDTGLFQTAFMAVHSIASIPLGVLAERRSRKRLIAMGVGVWSVATGLAGFATGFWHMFFARASVGIGEATYAPAASALISQKFKRASRAKALAIFQLGTVIGSAGGIALGGLIASRLGWRAAFFIVGVPGLALAALVLFVREPALPPRPVERAASASQLMAATPPGSIPAVLAIQVAGICFAFFTGAIGTFGPTYLLAVRFGGDASHMKEVVLTFGPIIVGAGVLGAVTGSFVADRLETWRPGIGRLLTIAIGAFVSAPFAATAFLSSSIPVQDIALGLGVFFNVWYIGPILAALHDVVPVHLRATVTGIYFCLIHALGDAISPWIVGTLGDMTGSLRLGLLVTTAVMSVGGIAALAAVPGARKVNRFRAATAS